MITDLIIGQIVQVISGPVTHHAAVIDAVLGPDERDDRLHIVDCITGRADWICADDALLTGRDAEDEDFSAGALDVIAERARE